MLESLQLETIIRAFQIGYPALFAMLDPIGNSLIFHSMTSHGTERERALLARRVAINVLLVMVVSLYAGSHILALFGISLDAVRIAGSLMVGVAAWQLLSGGAQRDPLPGRSDEPLAAMALVPLTIPLTAGPATISVMIAYGSVHGAHLGSDLGFLIGVTLAAALAALTLWFAYANAERLARRLGPVGQRTVTRLIGFLLLCIGAQMLLTGQTNILRDLLGHR